MESNRKQAALLLVSLIALVANGDDDGYLGCKKYCHNRRSPKCGSNGVTYLNRCHFYNARCDNPSLYIAGHGTCRQSGATRQNVRLCLNAGGGSDSDSGEPMFVQCASSNVGGNQGTNGGRGTNNGGTNGGGPGRNGGDNYWTVGTNGGANRGGNIPNGNANNRNGNGGAVTAMSGNPGMGNGGGNNGGYTSRLPNGGNRSVTGDPYGTLSYHHGKSTPTLLLPVTENACPDDCSKFGYSPVCGSDDTTYRNECTLDSIRCLNQPGLYKVSDGECPSKDGQRGDI